MKTVYISEIREPIEVDRAIKVSAVCYKTKLLFTQIGDNDTSNGAIEEPTEVLQAVTNFVLLVTSCVVLIIVLHQFHVVENTVDEISIFLNKKQRTKYYLKKRIMIRSGIAIDLLKTILQSVFFVLKLRKKGDNYNTILKSFNTEEIIYKSDQFSLLML